MLFNEIFATKVNEVGISWFDFYSIGHLCFGIGTFLLLSLFYTIPKTRGKTPICSLLFVFILTMFIMVIWEVLENILFVYLDLIWSTGLKFEGRPDSWQNLFTDILLGGIGALGTWAFAHSTFEKDKKIWPYYSFGLINLSIWLIFFIILRYLTFSNSPII
ncbi:MAG: hypothetical protein ACFFAN_10580 [Promethearchaeota archaeon]